MWVETPNGELVNLSKAESIELEKVVTSTSSTYMIVAWFDRGRRTIASFSKEDDAMEFYNLIKELLFGKKGGKNAK